MRSSSVSEVLSSIGCVMWGLGQKKTARHLCSGGSSVSRLRG
jgi:hypothetical protein